MMLKLVLAVSSFAHACISGRSRAPSSKPQCSVNMRSESRCLHAFPEVDLPGFQKKALAVFFLTARPFSSAGAGMSLSRSSLGIVTSGKNLLHAPETYEFTRRARSPVLSDTTKKRSSLDEWGALLRLAANDWPRLTAAIISLVVASTCEAYLPQFQSTAVNAAVGIDPSLDMRKTLLQLCILSGVSTVFAAVRAHLISMCSNRLVKRIRETVFSALHNQPQAFHDKQGRGELSSRLGSDCVRLGDVLSVNLSIVLRNLIQCIVSIGILWKCSARLTGLLLIVAALRACSTHVFSYRWRRLSKQEQEALATSSGVAEQCLSLIKLVRTYNGHRQADARYSQQLERILNIKKTQADNYALSILFGNFLDTISRCGIVILGGASIATGTLQRTDFFKFVLYATTVTNAMREMAGQWGSVQMAFGAADKVFDFLKMRSMDGTTSANSTVAVMRKPSSTKSEALSKSSPHIRLDQDAGQIDSVTLARRGALAFHDVNFAYPGRNDLQVLEKFSLSVAAGEKVAIVGESGSGKSTIFNLALRLYQPSGGCVTLDSVPLGEIDEDTLRSSIAWVQQEPPLFPNVTIRENIVFGLRDISNDAVEAAAKETAAYDFIQQLPEGFDTRIEAAGSSLSGGQKQRVALARALVRNPALLLLDEPTSALDPESEQAVEKSILQASKVRTVIFTTHKVAQAQLADRILVMANGKIVEEGSHDELIQRNGAYAAYARGGSAAYLEETSFEAEESAKGLVVPLNLSAEVSLESSR